MPTLGERFRKSWNAFMGRDPTTEVIGNVNTYINGGSSRRPDRPRMSFKNERTIVNTIYNRIAVDVSLMDFKHCHLNETRERYQNTIESHLNSALTISANLDQTGRDFIRDLVISMFDEGVVAIYPTETTKNIYTNNTFDVYSMRTAKVKEWYPNAVKLEVYDELNGKKREVISPKAVTPIIENPFYSIMNEPNSIAKRLIRVLNALDQVNEQTAAGKLDMIIQLPYSTRSDMRQAHAEVRRKQLEEQLTGSRYGIAYADVSEKIIQLNRSLENNLFEQSKSLEDQLYSQFGLTPGVFNGTAKEEERLNYENKTIEPILIAICEEMKRKWLSPTAITQGQTIMYFKNPLKMIPMSQVAEMADKMTRNEIMTSNELRSVLGLTPSNDPKADQLVNSNLNQSPEEMEMHGIGYKDQDEDLHNQLQKINLNY